MNEVTVIPPAMDKRAFYCCTCGNQLMAYPKTRILKPGDPEYSISEETSAVSLQEIIEDLNLFGQTEP